MNDEEFYAFFRNRMEIDARIALIALDTLDEIAALTRFTKQEKIPNDPQFISETWEQLMLKLTEKVNEKIEQKVREGLKYSTSEYLSKELGTRP